MLWTMDMFLVKAKKDQATFWDLSKKIKRGLVDMHQYCKNDHSPVLNLQESVGVDPLLE